MELKNSVIIGRGSIEGIFNKVSIEVVYVDKDAIIATAPSHWNSTNR